MFRPISPGHHQVTIVPNTDNIMIFAIFFTFLQFYTDYRY